MELSILIVILITSIIQGQIGVGLLAFGTPILLIMGVDYLEAMSILLPCSLALSLIQIIEGRSFIRSISQRDFLLLLPATAFGFLVWHSFKEELEMKPIIGLVMLATAILINHEKLSRKLKVLLNEKSALSLVFIGLIHGLTNMGGSFLTLLSSAKLDNKKNIRTYVALGYLLMAIVQISAAKITNPANFDLQSNYILIAVFGYLAIAKKIFNKFNEDSYKLTIQYAVISLAVIALAF